MRRVLVVSHRYVDPANRGKLRALAARGFEVTVAVPQRWREPVLGRTIDVSWERQHGVEVFPVKASHPGDAATYRFNGRVLHSLLRDKRPELIQVEEELSTAAARQTISAALKLGIPIILSVGTNVRRRHGLFTSWARRRVLRRVRGAFAHGAGAAELLRAEGPGLSIEVVPQLGVSVPAAPEHRPHEGLALGFVGRLVRRKGVDTLLEALAQHRASPWRLTVVGDGPEREALESLASARRLAARVRWAGSLPATQLTDVWPDLDVLVVPSRNQTEWRESVGHALAEAMAHEVAVIGTNAGVTPEVIGEAGMVVPPDDANALAAAIGRMADPAVQRQLAAAARARALKCFSDDAVAERTLEFWKRVIDETGETQRE